MTVYRRHGFRIFECNARIRGGVQCSRVIRFAADRWSTQDATAEAVDAGWEVVEPAAPDGGVHCCPYHAGRWE